MPRGQERHLFAGGNTPLGFYSFYDHIAPPNANRILIIKGGPGVGKSTMMKRIGLDLQDQGYDVEYFHCSSDNNSLDGVRIPALEVIVIDGTSPHIVDPRYPGAVDEIINLGDFWDDAAIRSHRADIYATTSAISKLFKRVYRFLAAAKSIYDDVEAINQEGFSVGRANEMAASLIASIFGHRPVSADAGRVRHLFASAFTPGGQVNFLANLMDPVERKFVLTGSPGTGKTTIVQKVVQAAVERGFYVEALHCPFDPSKVEHAIIPALNCAVITSTPPHTYTSEGAHTINMDLCRDPETAIANMPLAEAHTRLCQDLIDQAIRFLAQAKELHDRLETYYVPHMDFNAVEAARQAVVKRILDK